MQKGKKTNRPAANECLQGVCGQCSSSVDYNQHASAAGLLCQMCHTTSVSHLFWVLRFTCSVLSTHSRLPESWYIIYIYGVCNIVAYLLTLLLVSVSDSFDVVVAGSQQRVEVAALRSKDPHSAIQHDDRPNNGLPALVPHHATHPFVHLNVGRAKGKLKDGLDFVMKWSSTGHLTIVCLQ